MSSVVPAKAAVSQPAAGTNSTGGRFETSASTTGSGSGSGSTALGERLVGRCFGFGGAAAGEAAAAALVLPVAAAGAVGAVQQTTTPTAATPSPASMAGFMVARRCFKAAKRQRKERKPFRSKT